MIYGAAVRKECLDFEYLIGGWDGLCNHPPPNVVACAGENILRKMADFNDSSQI